MKFTAALAAAVLSATSSLAAPVAAGESKSMMAAAPQWTIESLVRTCNADDTSCDWSFGINTGLAAPATACAFAVQGSPASRAGSSGNVCGAYTVSTGWSGQFQEGFTTLSVVDFANKLIVWPAYTDGQLVNGQVVVPDQSYAPTTLA
ncbi:small secreted protein [Xylariomycetidae sp. FL2044]|nr:small secreted protein [Xylariomycetidae sp. FL2044]